MTEQERAHLIFVRPVGDRRVPMPGGNREAYPAEGMWVDERDMFVQRRILQQELEIADPPADMPRPGDEEPQSAPAPAPAPAPDANAEPAAVDAAQHDETPPAGSFSRSF
jgi:hypothetical protein